MAAYLSLDLIQSMLIPSVSVLEKILRPICVYIFLVILLRIFGKRELAQLNPFDLVVLLSLSNTVQNAIIGNDNSVSGGMIGAFTLVAFNYVVVRFLFRHRRLDQIFEGKPSRLIENGKLNNHALARELLTVSDLTAAAHRQGFRNLKEIETCILEPGGAIFMERKGPPEDEERYDQIMQKLDLLVEKISAKELSS